MPKTDPALASEQTDGVAYLQPATVAEHLQVDVQTVYKWIRTGELSAVNLGTELRPTWRIEEQALAKFIEERTKP